MHDEEEGIAGDMDVETREDARVLSRASMDCSKRTDINPRYSSKHASDAFQLLTLHSLLWLCLGTGQGRMAWIALRSIAVQTRQLPARGGTPGDRPAGGPQNPSYSTWIPPPGAEKRQGEQRWWQDERQKLRIHPDAAGNQAFKVQQEAHSAKRANRCLLTIGQHADDVAHFTQKPEGS